MARTTATRTLGGRDSLGTWTLDEQHQFERGVITHGWGNWRTIELLVPTRDRIQIKSHAQKFRKHHPIEYATLQQDHEACAEAEAVVSAKKIKKGKATPRRRGSLSKAKTPTDRAIVSPRPLRRCSAPAGIMGLKVGGGATKRRSSIRSIKASSPTIQSPKKKIPKKKTGKKPPPKLLPFLTLGGGAGLCRVTLGAPSTISAKSYDLMSPRAGRPLPAAPNHDPPEDCDELAAMAAVVTPSPDPKFAFRNLLDEAIDMDDIIDTLSLTGLTKLENEHEGEVIDQLLQLKVDDNNLDMIADFFDPSWNVMMDDENGISPKDGDFLVPITSLSEGPEGTPGSDYDGKPLLEIPVNVCPDLQLFMDIRTQLTSSPDYNNPKEYVLGEDGLSRAGVETGALFRVRIKHLLEDHLGMGWWREDMFDIAPLDASATGAAAIQSPLGTLGMLVNGGGKGGDEGGMFGKVAYKKFALERLIALAAVMLDVDHWHFRNEAQEMTITDGQRFNDEDDIRHIGQLLSGLWERVSRSLQRDDLALLGDDSSARMERNAAINTMVGRLDSICRQENIKSPHVSMTSV
eukprot:CAMPEP_0172311886 /NCGR_PEP_ID=MMETSP1058-20130122/15950_1 /TAXON_ID=83371 /ORGANISM="Detonula confervacea, Strain CCMP 353" /LENGTH=573 /DNA_ID=CAMNT_0013025195 /DNA_START=25 /DNA_END=1746 /DNA_ORIENTATION=+